MHIYDKAKYHSQGDFPKNLHPDKSYVYGGMFFAWCAENKLLSDYMYKDFRDEIEKILIHAGKPSDLYRISGGVLSGEELNIMGNAFASSYFDSDLYVDDFIEFLADHVPSVYHVDDTFDNYEILKYQINNRFNQWKDNNT